MAYSSASDVAALCRNLIGGASNFTTATSPTLTQVNAWLSTGCALINSVIGINGYSAIPQSSAAYGIAVQTESLFGAYMAERSRTNATVSAQERTRGGMFKTDFDQMLDMLKVIDLGSLGVSQKSSVYAGGISLDDKDTIESDTDRVTPRFTRGLFSDKTVPREGDLGSQTGDPQSR